MLDAWLCKAHASEPRSSCAQAALGAGMPCLITYTRSTKSEDFQGAVRIVESLAKVKLADLQSNDSVKDDR